MKSGVHTYFNNPEKYLHRSFGVRLRAEIVRSFIGEVNSATILDAGCGDGGVSLQFLANNKITFCDLAENMLKLVEQQIPLGLRSNSQLVNSSIENFKSAVNFDFIFCIGVLAHVPSVRLALHNLTKCLSNDGSLVIQFSDYDHWLTRISARIAGYDYTVNKIRKAELVELINQLGFTIERKVKYSFMLPGMGKLPDSLLYKMQRLTWRFNFLQSLGTEHIWLLRKL